MTLCLSALLGLLASPQAPAEMPLPEVVVRAEVAERIDYEFKSDAARKSFLRHLEETVAREAGKLHCLNWQPGGGSAASGTPRAELWVRLIDVGSQILLSYAGNYDKPLPPNVSREQLARSLQPLPKHLNRPLLTGYAGYLDLLKSNFDKAVTGQFGEESFEVQFNQHFISKVVIAESLGFDDKLKAAIVPVAAEKMSLEPGADLQVLLKQAPVCNDWKDCAISLKGEGPWYHENYKGGLRCSFPSGKADCCNPLTWSDLTGGAKGAHRRAVLLGQHKHSPPWSTPDGLYRHLEAP